VTGQSLYATISSIEWLALFFLIGVFVMVGALEHTAALEQVSQKNAHRAARVASVHRTAAAPRAASRGAQG
jgi:Na+/H+ antiporter NhaD/arsenite permease-like protein